MYFFRLSPIQCTFIMSSAHLFTFNFYRATLHIFNDPSIICGHFSNI
jgi:hypothetical protein